MRRTSYLRWSLCGTAMLALAGCGDASFADVEHEKIAEAQDELTTSNAISANAISANAISANAISANAISANAISANAISANAISANAISANQLTMAALNDTSPSIDPRYRDMGRLNEEFLRYAYSCAMPAGTSMTLTLDRGDVTFQGSIGLAPQWATQECDENCQRWVSACLIARVNGYHVPIDISLRGNHEKLATTVEEEAEFPLFEGRFWGNVFQNEFENNFMSCYGTGATEGQLTSRVCAQSGGYCGIKSTGACGAQCNSQQNCQATPAGGGTPINIPSIGVWLRQPDPSMCGDGACEAGETSANCSHDCPTTINSADHETSNGYVRTLAATALDANTIFYAGITNSPTLAGLGAVDPPDVAGTEDTFIIKAGANGSYVAATRVAAGWEDPVALEVDSATGRLIMANEYALRSFDTATLGLQWTRQEKTAVDRFRFESLTVKDGFIHTLGYAQTFNGTSWVTVAREYRKYDIATGSIVGTPTATTNNAWKHWTGGGCYAYMTRAYNNTKVEVRAKALTQNAGCSTATDWVQQVIVPGISTPKPTAIAEGLVVAGTSGDLTTSFIGRYFENGTGFAWVNKISPPAGRAVRIDQMITLGQNVVVAGEFQGPIDFRGSISSPLSGRWPGVNANDDVFVAAYDLATGELRWVRTYGGPGVDALTAFTFDASNRLWLFGDFVGTPMLEGSFRTAVNGELDTDGMRVTVGPLPMGAAQTLSTTSDGTHSLLVENGKVKVWGSNDYGQLGLGYTSAPADPIARPVELPGIAQAIKASSGTNWSMVLLADGTVLTFGDNSQGQLGDGTLVSRNAPAAVPGLAGVVDIVANDQSALALLADGTVKAWGRNGLGELGDGTWTLRKSPVTVSGLSSIVSLAGGSKTSMAVDAGGKLWSWGYGSKGVLGNNSTNNRNIPAIVAGVERPVRVRVGGGSAFAIQANGKVMGWGNNTAGKLGDGTTTHRWVPTEIPNLGNIVDISTGSGHTIARTSTGDILTWGDGTSGKLGTGSLTSSTTPTLLADLHHARSVFAGKDATMVVLENGDVVGFGNAPELGAGIKTGIAKLPVKTNAVSLERVGGGIGFALALRADGSVWAAGAHDLGQLGNGQTTGSRNYMATVPGLADVRGISAGDGHFALAVQLDGQVKAWGQNTNGQLGDGTTTDRSSPVLVPGLTNVAKISCGYLHSVALTKQGTVHAFGLNSSGQLGDGTSTQRTSPIQVPGLTDVTDLHAGRAHSIALKSDGSVWVWGLNSKGQCGINSVTPSTIKSPTQVSGLSDIIAIGAGKEFSMALDSSGKVYTWGDNSRGQLGDGTNTNRLSPVQVPGLSDVIAIAAGGYHALALKSDGSVWAWGLNVSGQVGNGMTTDQASPVLVTDIQGVASIKAVFNRSMAVKRDGTFWMWGNNDSGEFGDHTMTNRTRPVQILDL